MVPAKVKVTLSPVINPWFVILSASKSATTDCCAIAVFVLASIWLPASNVKLKPFDAVVATSYNPSAAPIKSAENLWVSFVAGILVKSMILTLPFLYNN